MVSSRAETVLAQSPPNGKAQRTYRLLVRTVRSVLAATGTFTPDQVAAAARVGTATFYSYFASRDEALAAAFDLVLDDLDREAARHLAVEPLLDHGLEATLAAAIEGVIARFTADQFVFRVAVARLPESRLLRAIYRRRQKEGLDIIRRFVELGIAAGRIRTGDPVVMATALLVLLQGCNNPILLHPGTDQRVLAALVGAGLGLLAPAGSAGENHPAS